MRGRVGQWVEEREGEREMERGWGRWKEREREYLFFLPLQIARDLQSFFPKVGISPLKLPVHGVSFRFDPINSFPGTEILDLYQVLHGKHAPVKFVLANLRYL